MIIIITLIYLQQRNLAIHKMTTAGIILCTLLRILLLKEVVMQMPLQGNLENFKDLKEDSTEVKDFLL